MDDTEVLSNLGIMHHSELHPLFRTFYHLDPTLEREKVNLLHI